MQQLTFSDKLSIISRIVGILGICITIICSVISIFQARKAAKEKKSVQEIAESFKQKFENYSEANFRGKISNVLVSLDNLLTEITKNKTK